MKEIEEQIIGKILCALGLEEFMVCVCVCVHTYNYYLFKKENSVICDNMDELRGRFAEWN